jgi:hypothetical protein
MKNYIIFIYILKIVFKFRLIKKIALIKKSKYNNGKTIVPRG